MTIIVFLVVGVIFLGVATPTEAAALGCVGSFSLAGAYGGLSFEGVKKAVMGTVKLSVMMLTIMAAAIGFSQILAFTGASRDLLQFVVALTESPIALMLVMQVVLLFLGCFMEQIAIMLITLPIFMPIIHAMNIDPIWFAVLMLINLEIALMTPPFGLLLFIMKGVAPPEIKMQSIYASVLPYIAVNLIVIGLVLAWPDLVLFLPRNLR